MLATATFPQCSESANGQSANDRLESQLHPANGPSQKRIESASSELREKADGALDDTVNPQDLGAE
jgi:hypothetical protein